MHLSKKSIGFNIVLTPVRWVLSIKGHFLRVYAQEGGCFTTGAEFLDVTPEQQIRLVGLYALHRPHAAGA